MPQPLLRTDPAILIALIAAFLVEQIADKIPGVDHVSDLVHLPIKPAAAVGLAMVVAGPGDPSQLADCGVPLAVAAAAVHCSPIWARRGFAAGAARPRAGRIASGLRGHSGACCIATPFTPKREKSAGTTTMFSASDVRRPPRTTTASGL